METSVAADTKKLVCRRFTSVLRTSPLKDDVDPKSFFMMLHTNFALVLRNGRIDLAPIWNALSPTQTPERLIGLLLKLAEVSADLGFQADLPGAVAELSNEERSAHLARFTNGHAAVDVVELESDDFFGTDPSAEAISLPLNTGDIVPFVPPDLRKRIISVVVQAIKTAPIGQRVDRAQFAYLLNDSFDELCDGTTFDFNPILEGLRQLPGVEDSQIVLAVARLGPALADLQITLKDTRLEVTEELKARIVADANRAEAAAAAEAAAIAARGGLVDPNAKQLEEPPAERTRATTREARLRKWGLSPGVSVRWQLVRYGILAVVLLSVGLGAWLTRPNRPLDASDYRAVFPLKSAEFRFGAFNGVLDEKVWYSFDSATRAAKLRGFEELMANEGKLANLQIRDSRNRLVVTNTGPRRLGAARFLMQADQDGNVPE